MLFLLNCDSLIIKKTLNKEIVIKKYKKLKFIEDGRRKDQIKWEAYIQRGPVTKPGGVGGRSERRNRKINKKFKKEKRDSVSLCPYSFFFLGKKTPFSLPDPD